MESDEVCYYNGTTEVVLCREEELVFFFYTGALSFKTIMI